MGIEKLQPAVLPPGLPAEFGNRMVNRVQTLRINLNISNQAMCAQQEMLYRERDRYSTKFGCSTSQLLNFKTKKDQHAAASKEDGAGASGHQSQVNKQIQRTMSIR